jgi:hypothetical protein
VSDWCEFSRCAEEIRTFLLRGDDGGCGAAQEVPESMMMMTASAEPAAAPAAATPRGTLGGLLVPFTWNFLLDASSSEEREQRRKNAAEWLAACDADIVAAHSSGQRLLFNGRDAAAEPISDSGCPRCRGCSRVLSARRDDDLIGVLPVRSILGARFAAEVEDYAPTAADTHGVPAGQISSRVPAGPAREEASAFIRRLRTRPEHEVEYFGMLSSSTSLSVRSYHFPSETRRAVIARITNPRTMCTLETRWFISFRSREDRSGRCLAQLLVLPGSATKFQDGIEQLFDRSCDSKSFIQLLTCGYGRVETDKPPRVSLKHLMQCRASLGLSADFPLSLLWNVLISASGAAFDLLGQQPQLRLHHRLALLSWWEELAIM